MRPSMATLTVRVVTSTVKNLLGAVQVFMLHDDIDIFSCRGSCMIANGFLII